MLLLRSHVKQALESLNRVVLASVVRVQKADQPQRFNKIDALKSTA
jgi:hypothetical protein